MDQSDLDRSNLEKYDMLWCREDRSYYFTHEIPCCMVERAGKKIRIMALLRRGGEREHLVDQKNLRHSPCHCFGECRVFERLDRGVRKPQESTGATYLGLAGQKKKAESELLSYVVALEQCYDTRIMTLMEGMVAGYCVTDILTKEEANAWLAKARAFSKNNKK